MQQKGVSKENPHHHQKL